MIVMSAKHVILPNALMALQQAGMIVLTRNDNVCAAVIAVSSDPVYQSQTIDRLQQIIKETPVLSFLHSDDTGKPDQVIGSSSDSSLDTLTDSWISKLCNADSNVAAVIHRQTSSVKTLLEKVLHVLMDPLVKVKSTRTAGGDLRFYFTRVNFAEIRFQAKSLIVRLRPGRDVVNHSDFK